MAALRCQLAYAANNGSSEMTIGDDDKDEPYKGSVSVAGNNESSVHKLANIDQAAAEQVALSLRQARSTIRS